MISPAVMPESTIELKPAKVKSYITHEAIESAKAFPNQPIPLNDGKFVDKAYCKKLQEQARRVNPALQVHFRLRKTWDETNASGKKTYYYKGPVFLSLGDVDNAKSAPPAESAEQEAPDRTAAPLRTPVTERPAIATGGLLHDLAEIANLELSEPEVAERIEALAWNVIATAQRQGKSLSMTAQILGSRQDLDPELRERLERSIVDIEMGLRRRFAV